MQIIHAFWQGSRARRFEGKHYTVKGAHPGPQPAREPFHFADGRQQPGHDPQRGDYNSFATFDDPDGNVWLIQERKKDPYEAA